MTITSTPKLPYLHLNARSRQITYAEARAVFADESARGVDLRLGKYEYLNRVMP